MQGELFAVAEPQGIAPWRLFMVGLHGRTWSGAFHTRDEAVREGRRHRREYLNAPHFVVELLEVPA